ncbi:MAG: type I restriction enzyme HsdR N-terminal domain-containing protein [Anaerolineae bacterium]|nr:type I restriction enzyme HsdR N-terminal domain-containing protein [Anaerolineae bacterium]
MDFIDKLRELAAKIPQQVEHIRTEEATKSALVMPFINHALGYNVFDPSEVTPEFIADVGVKKGEKVDYVILKDGQPIMMFECKSVNTELDKITPSQLYRYFSVSPVRIGILTNGIVYRFYSDLEEQNKMDSKPFLELNMLNLEEPVVEEVKRFVKPSFDIETILVSASEFKATREIKRILTTQLQEPSDEFVKVFASQIHPGRVTPYVKGQFAQYVKRAFNQFINEQINARLKSAAVPDVRAPVEQPTTESAPATTATGGAAVQPANGGERQILTTAEELEAFYIIKAILRDVVEAKRIVMRDAQSYCAILLDDNNRRPICRLYFNNSARRVVCFVDEQRHEDRVPIQTLDDLYGLVDRLKTVVAAYIKQPTGQE